MGLNNQTDPGAFLLRSGESESRMGRRAELQIKGTNHKRLHADLLQATKTTALGDGLYLIVKGAEPLISRSWALRYTSPATRKTREIGLGSFPVLGIPAARAKAAELRRDIAAGNDPLIEVVEDPGETFREAMEVHIARRAKQWRDDPRGREVSRSERQWRSSLETHALPRLGHRKARSIKPQDVLDVLNPIWATTTATATRLRERIEAILDDASVRAGWENWTNPATWKGRLEYSMSAPKQKPGHFRAVHYSDMPDLMKRLQAKSGVGIRAIEFTALTASRSGPVFLARWSEIDFENRIWAIPAEHMKRERAFSIPLSEPAMAVLDQMRPLRNQNHGDYIFPGQKPGRPQSSNTMRANLIRLGVDGTVHGFRSAFAGWAAERVPLQQVQLALSQAMPTILPGGKVLEAYVRDQLESLRPLLQQWGEYLTTPPAQQVEAA